MLSVDPRLHTFQYTNWCWLFRRSPIVRRCCYYAKYVHGNSVLTMFREHDVLIIIITVTFLPFAIRIVVKSTNRNCIIRNVETGTYSRRHDEYFANSDEIWFWWLRSTSICIKIGWKEAMWVHRWLRVDCGAIAEPIKKPTKTNSDNQQGH